jgi:hypothetical protein
MGAVSRRLDPNKPGYKDIGSGTRQQAIRYEGSEEVVFRVAEGVSESE